MSSYPFHCICQRWPQCRKVKLVEVALYVDCVQDESYTPQKMSFRVGNKHDELQEIKTCELEEPRGWVVISLASSARYVILQWAETVLTPTQGAPLMLLLSFLPDRKRVHSDSLPSDRDPVKPPEWEGHAPAPTQSFRATNVSEKSVLGDTL